MGAYHENLENTREALANAAAALRNASRVIGDKFPALADQLSSDAEKTAAQLQNVETELLLYGTPDWYTHEFSGLTKVIDLYDDWADEYGSVHGTEILKNLRPAIKDAKRLLEMAKGATNIQGNT